LNGAQSASSKVEEDSKTPTNQDPNCQPKSAKITPFKIPTKTAKCLLEKEEDHRIILETKKRLNDENLNNGSDNELPQNSNKSNREELEMKNERLRIYRQRVEQKLRARLDNLVDKIGTEFQNIHLNFDQCYQFTSIWKSPDWKAVEERCKEMLKERKRKMNEPKMEEVQLKMPKLEIQIDAKKPRGRPRQMPLPIKIQKVKGRPGRKAKNSLENEEDSM
jgi:hypothetical protein